MKELESRIVSGPLISLVENKQEERKGGWRLLYWEGRKKKNVKE